MSNTIESKTVSPSRAAFWGVVATVLLAFSSSPDDVYSWAFGSAVEKSNFVFLRIAAYLVGGILTGLAAYLYNASSIQFQYEKRKRIEAEQNSAALTEKLQKLEAELSANKLQAHTHRELAFDVIHDLFGGYLRSLLKGLATNGEVSNDIRLTVYSHRKDSNTFSQIGRYSESPPFGGKGRNSYSIDSGSIGRAWLQRECFVPSLPDPIKEKQKYKKVLIADWHMTEDEVDNLKMKSRSMLAVRIAGNTIGVDKIGVVLIESLEPNLDSGYQDFLRQLAEKPPEIFLQVISYEYRLHEKLGSAQV